MGYLNEKSREHTELFEHALRAGLTSTQALDWVREQMRPKAPVQEQTPTLFGSWMARTAVAKMKGAQQA